MPVIYQSRIYRADLKANPEVMYLFGDNMERSGYGGQAAEMRGEPNAIGIPTKWAPNNHPSSFFRDEASPAVLPVMDKDIGVARLHLAHGGTVVIPLDGLGTGLSRLPEKAPKINAWLVEELEAMRNA